MPSSSLGCDLSRIDTAVDEFLFWICGVPIRVGVAFTFDAKIENDCVLVSALHAGDSILLVSFYEEGQPSHAFKVSFQGDETQTVCKNFICYDGSIILNIDFFDGEGRDFGKEYTAKGIGDGGIDADEGECSFISLVLVEDDFEIFLEIV